MTPLNRVVAAIRSTLSGHMVDVVAFVEELLATTREVGHLQCTLAREGVLRLGVGNEKPSDVELDSARAKLRMICARLGVLCQERGRLNGSLYGGDGVLSKASGSVSPGFEGWAVRFSNTPSEQGFTIIGSAQLVLWQSPS